METPYGLKRNNVRTYDNFLYPIKEENEIDFTLERIEEKLDKLISIVEKNTEDCEKMSSHIDFVENVYSNLKSPLEYVRWKLGFKQENLPQIKNS